MENSFSPVTPASTSASTVTPVWQKSPAGQYYVNSVAVSADASLVVAGTFFNTYGESESRRTPPAAGALKGSQTGTYGTYCYDGVSGALLWKNEFQGYLGVYWVAISADGGRAASGGQRSDSYPEGFVQAFDTSSGNSLLDQSTDRRVNQVALSQDGTWLVSAAETLLLFKYDSVQGKYVQAAVYVPPAASAAALPGSSSNAVVSVGLSADGTTIVLSDYSAHIIVLKNQDGTLTQEQIWTLPSSFCHMVALTPDGSAFAAGGSSGSFYLCDTAQFIQSGSLTYTYSTGISGPVYGVAVDAGGQVFACVVNAGSEAGVVHVVQIQNGAVVPIADFPTARNPNSVSLNIQAGGLMAVADGHPDNTPGNFYLYKGVSTAAGSTPTLAWQYTTGDMSWPITIAAHGKAVVGGSDDSNVYYFAV